MNESVRVAGLLWQARNVAKDEKAFAKLEFNGPYYYTGKTNDNDAELARYIASFVKELVRVKT